MQTYIIEEKKEKYFETLNCGYGGNKVEQYSDKLKFRITGKER